MDQLFGMLCQMRKSDFPDDLSSVESFGALRASVVAGPRVTCSKR